MSLPSPIGLPAEMRLGDLDLSLPADARSYAIKVVPSNVQSVASPAISMIAATSSAPTTLPQFPSQTIYFDLPAASSPSTFLDVRFTTLSFQATLTVTVAGTASAGFASANLRNGAYSFFDRMYITGQSGNIVEDINEFGMVNALLCDLQLNSATRDTLALQYGFLSDPAATTAQGHSWAGLATNVTTIPITTVETHSYSIPLLSGLIGAGADKMFNIGRTSKLQVALQTSNELPISMVCNGTTAIAAGTFVITLSNFSIQTEYIDIGAQALAMLDATLIDGKAYNHGVSYKVAGVTMSQSQGNQSLLAGIRGSSVKSLFTKFVDGGAVSTTNSANGKYDSKNPSLNSINYNIGGLRYPNAPVNPLLAPANVFRNLQLAIGSYNNAGFQSAIIPAQFCKLSAGGTAQALTVGATQDYNYSLGSSFTALCQFIYGENLEVCMKRGLMSGLNCNSAPVFVELNAAVAPTNIQTAYVFAMIDMVVIHDTRTGDIQVRM